VTEHEKIKRAYRIALDAFREEFEYNAVGGESNFSIIGPMAAEIYRQSNRVMIIKMGKKTNHDTMRQIGNEIQRAEQNASPTVIVLSHEYEVFCSDAETVAIGEAIPGEDDGKT